MLPHAQLRTLKGVCATTLHPCLAARSTAQTFKRPISLRCRHAMGAHLPHLALALLHHAQVGGLGAPWAGMPHQQLTSAVRVLGRPHKAARARAQERAHLLPPLPAARSQATRADTVLARLMALSVGAQCAYLCLYKVIQGAAESCTKLQRAKNASGVDTGTRRGIAPYCLVARQQQQQLIFKGMPR